MKFEVTKTIEFEVTATIEAMDETEAEAIMDSAQWCAETCDEAVIVTECGEQRSSTDNIINLAEQKWESMSKLERAGILKENGASDESAYETADMDFSDIPDEWKEYF